MKKELIGYLTGAINRRVAVEGNLENFGGSETAMMLNENYKAELSDLLDFVERFTEENVAIAENKSLRELEDKVKNLETENKLLKIDCEGWKIRRNEWSKNYKELYKENEQLKKRNSSLELNHDAVQGANERMKEENEGLNRHIDLLNSIIKNTYDVNKTLEEKNRTLKSMVNEQFEREKVCKYNKEVRRIFGGAK